MQEITVVLPSVLQPLAPGLGDLVPVELVGDGGGVAAQALDDSAEPHLVVRPHFLPDGLGRLVPRGVELGEPLLELGPLLQKGFDAVVGIRGHSGRSSAEGVDLFGRPDSRDVLIRG